MRLLWLLGSTGAVVGGALLWWVGWLVVRALDRSSLRPPPSDEL